MSKVYIWGAGRVFQKLMEEGVFKECEILGIIDTYHTGTILGYPMISPDKINKDYDFIIISVLEPGEIVQQCGELGLDLSKIAVIFNYAWKYLKFVNQDDDVINEKMPSVHKKIMEIKENQKIPRSEIYTCYYDAKDEDRLIGRDYKEEYFREYIRYRAFELAAKELKKLENQNWNVAELGVFRGAFSHLINRKFQDKTLYMFDTFEGFDSDEAERERKDGHCDDNFIEYFADNNVNMVINSMPFKEQCIVRKGLFPKTAEGLEKNVYGFVSLDVDFGDSTLFGLEYFYPRLIEGGYIFVHDYNHASLEGVKDAIERYEKKYQMKLKKVPLPDSNGTLVITK